MQTQAAAHSGADAGAGLTNLEIGVGGQSLVHQPVPPRVSGLQVHDVALCLLIGQRDGRVLSTKNNVFKRFSKMASEKSIVEKTSRKMNDITAMKSVTYVLLSLGDSLDSE